MVEGNFIQIPFSKSEVFSNSSLSLLEKNQLVRVIEICIKGYDMLVEHRVKVNSTHVYDKEIELRKSDQELCFKLKDASVSEFFQELNVKEKMQNILLYAIGQVNEVQQQPKVENISTFEFFERMQKYLRSIGYYGSAPFLMATYGSSEYGQAFSRVGSLHQSIYIVNKDIGINKLNISEEGNFESVELSLGEGKIPVKQGLIVSKDYEHLVNQKEAKVKSLCLRMTLITKKTLTKG